MLFLASWLCGCWFVGFSVVVFHLAGPFTPLRSIQQLGWFPLNVVQRFIFHRGWTLEPLVQTAGHRFLLCCKVSRRVQDGLTQKLWTWTTGWWFVVLREMSWCTVTFPSGWIVPSLIVAPSSDQILTQSYILFYDQLSTKHKAFPPTDSGGGGVWPVFISSSQSQSSWMVAARVSLYDSVGGTCFACQEESPGIKMAELLQKKRWELLAR